jgi:hypothetical protein
MRVLVLVGWGTAALLVGTWLALVEVFWLPLRVGGLLVPVSILAAVVGNLLVVGTVHRWSGSRVVAVLPVLAWLVVALAATRRRPEGDLLIVGTGALGYVGLAFLLVGAVAAAFAVGRVLAGPRRPRDQEGSVQDCEGPSR